MNSFQELDIYDVLHESIIPSEVARYLFVLVSAPDPFHACAINTTSYVYCVSVERVWGRDYICALCKYILCI